MDEKILDFEASKYLAQSLRDTIMQNLHAVPADFASEYTKGTCDFVDSVLVFKEIIDYRNSPRVSKYLIEKMNDRQIEQLNLILLGLISKEPEEKIKEIVEATLNFTIPTEEGFKKSKVLLDHLKIYAGEYEAKSKQFANLSRRIQTIATICTILNMGDEFHDLLIDRFSRLSENDLDSLISAFHFIEKYQEEKQMYD